MKRATIKEVAQKAGVSIATVSRVLNRMGGYGEETRRLIEETVRELGYQPNSAARALKTSRSSLLGFMLPKAQTTSLERILYAFEQEADHVGYQVVVCRAENDPAQVEKRVRLLSRLQVDGTAFCAHQPGEAFDRAAGSFHGPGVLICNPSATGRIPSVRTDDFAGAYDAARYLYERGHRKFAFLIGPKNDMTAGMTRFNGYRQALIDRGVVPNDSLVFYGTYSYQETLQTARRLVACHDRFTAVLAASDDMATAVLTEGYHAGLHVPDAFSIIGYDDLITARMAIPPLTTVAQPFEELGRRAVHMLLQEIQTGQKPETCVLPVHIISRDTVRTLPTP